MSKRRIEKFLLNYFESNNYSETLKTFQDEIKEENTETRILSFKIIKAPKIIVDIEEKRKKSRKKEEVKIPKEFKRIAKRAGIPKDQFEFFYEHRESFNWELFKPTVYCTVCKETSEHYNFCFTQHMKEKHNYSDTPCNFADCKFVANSESSLLRHQASFHGMGKRKPSARACLKCKYPSCNYQASIDYALQRHYSIHENRSAECYL
ncbi:Oidioi.mRNA.OKI2018_I69.PAR.g10971.t1.cds [Oikopleura dioica]|uniref:Oidioi.mRNA.OKI2018_I69.PAR.g10971.t1.cds n=1 Tax=Oikopleura dioica TaxID=34765 RepID=A0ABN7S078_OIKDI|nr:Oidioi.mRNA.OKI2018_I69.PAR.g10971.t1.cds [Oikopleura dioica]